jgi:hypothetical protein
MTVGSRHAGPSAKPSGEVNIAAGLSCHPSFPRRRHLWLLVALLVGAGGCKESLLAPNEILITNYSGVDLVIHTASGSMEPVEMPSGGPGDGFGVDWESCLDDVLVAVDEHGRERARNKQPCGGDHWAIRQATLDPPANTLEVVNRSGVELVVRHDVEGEERRLGDGEATTYVLDPGGPDRQAQRCLDGSLEVLDPDGRVLARHDELCINERWILEAEMLAPPAS